MKNQPSKRKNRLGDRKDAWLVRNLDGMHVIMPFVYPNRADNEAFIRETIDLTPALAYLEKKNENNAHPELPYKIFHLVVAALVKTATLRPLLNRFIRGKRFWDRKELSAAFVVKKILEDNADEVVAYLNFPEDTTLDSIHEKILKKVTSVRSGGKGIVDTMNFVAKMPHWLTGIVCTVIGWLDFHGRVPKSLMAGDPSYATFFITNLGSIKLNAGYHHLSNRGSNSIFVTIGEMGQKPFYDEKGKVEMRTTLDIGITLDERIADGVYYAKSIKLIKYLFAHPELLDRPANESVNYEGK